MKVSIIVPVYKVENYLNACVESIINQTYQDLEIILVDDGSPDNCPKMCDDWAKKDKRIKVIHKENGGLSSARNSGIEMSTGDFLMFVDSDDSINPQIIEILVKIQQDTLSDIAMCSWKKVQDINKPNNKKYNSESIDFVVFSKNDVFDLLYNKKVPLIMAAWAKLYKKDLFKNIRYPVGLIHEDEAVIHEILHICNKLSYVDYQMYNNTQRGDSITATSFSIKRLSILQIFKERIAFIEKNRPDFLDKAIHHYIRILILYYHYIKWAKMEDSILLKIKGEIDEQVKKGYKSKLTLMFYKFPWLLNLLLKIRQRIC